MRKHVVIGIAASLLLLGIYAGVMTLAEGFRPAIEQGKALWYWILGLMAGFGVQAALFSFIRDAARQRRAAAASVAASGGVSAGSMLACCAHHLSDFLPLLGASALSVFLARYQNVFLLAGVLSNVVGIALMLETIQRHGLSARLANLKYDLRLVRRGATLCALGLLVTIVIATCVRPS